MGFLTPEALAGPHYCPLPEHSKRLPAGTRWQCDDCGAIYRVEMVWDRNTMNLEWVLKQPAAPQPAPMKCGHLVARGLDRCVLVLGHAGGHFAKTQKSPAE